MSKLAQILVGDGNPNLGLRKVKTLESAGYGAFQVADRQSILTLAATEQPDIILLGRFRDPLEELEVARLLKEDDATKNIPIILYDAVQSTEIRAACVELQLADLLEGETTDETLLTRVPAILRMSHMRQELQRRAETSAEFGLNVDLNFEIDSSTSSHRRVMFVSESSEYQADLYASLLKAGLDTVLEQSPYRAAERLEQEDFSAVIITATLYDDREKVVYLVNHIRSNPVLFNLPSLIVKEPNIDPTEKALYAQGADVVITHDRDYELLATYVQMLLVRRELRDRVQSPYFDLLTAKTADRDAELLYSGAFFTQHAARELAVAEKRETPVCMAVISVPSIARITTDYSKKHADHLTSQIVNWINGMVRLSDMIGRIGPSTFGILMPFTRDPEARKAAFRITGILQKSEFDLGEDVTRDTSILVDAAVVEFLPGESADDLMTRGAKALVTGN